MLLTFKEKTLQEGREEGEKKGREKTKKAYKLFKAGKKPEEVAKELGFPTMKADELYDDFNSIFNSSNN